MSLEGLELEVGGHLWEQISSSRVAETEGGRGASPGIPRQTTSHSRNRPGDVGGRTP